MASRFRTGSRIVALSVAITLVGSSLASAQTPAPAPPADSRPQQALLSAKAFARLVQPIRSEVARPGTASQSAQPSLLRQSTTTAKLSHVPALPMKPPRRQNWFMRNPALAWLIIGGGIFLGGYLAACGFNTDCD